MYKGVVNIYMCYSQGDGLDTSLSRLFYLVYCTQWFSCCLVVHLYLYLVSVRYLVHYVLDALVNDIEITSTSASPASTSTPIQTVHPYPNVRALDHFNTVSEGILGCTGARTSGCTRGHRKQRRATPHEQPRGLECRSRCKNS